jgi:hypothetical protein
MNLDLADLGAVLVVSAPFALLFVWIVVMADGSRFEGLVVAWTDVESPVREEDEPVRWQTDLLVPRDERRASDSTVRPEPGPSGSVPRQVSRVRP